MTGYGSELESSEWQLNIPSLIWKSQKDNIALKNIKVEISANWPEIQLVGFDLPNARQFDAQGKYSAIDNKWNISLDAEELQMSDDPNGFVNLKFTSHGDMNNLLVEEMQLSRKNLHLDAAGSLALDTKKLSNAHAKISLVLPKISEPNNNFSNISGNFECETDISGTVWPMDVNLQAVLIGDNITMNKKSINPVKIPWQAKIDTNDIQYKSEKFQVFDGNWSLNGHYDFNRHIANISLNTEQVSLKPVLGLFDLPLESGGMMGASLDITLPGNDIDKMIISGNWNVNDMLIAPIKAQIAKGRIKIQN